MISPKAFKKMYNPTYATKIPKDKIKDIAVIIAASNVVIEDITRKGELVLKHLS